MQVNKILILTLGLSFLTSSADQITKSMALKPDGYYKDLGTSQDGYRRFSLLHRQNDKDKQFESFYFVHPNGKKCWLGTLEEVMNDVLADIVKEKINRRNKVQNPQFWYMPSVTKSYKNIVTILDGCKRFQIIESGFCKEFLYEYFVAPDGRFWIVRKPMFRSPYYDFSGFIKATEKVASIIKMLRKEREEKQ